MSLPEEELDPKFEFDAPKNYDFITHSSQVGDDWFEKSNTIEEFESQNKAINLLEKAGQELDSEQNFSLNPSSTEDRRSALLLFGNTPSKKNKALIVSSNGDPLNGQDSVSLRWNGTQWSSVPNIQNTSNIHSRISSTPRSILRKTSSQSNPHANNITSNQLNNSTWVPQLTVPISPQLSTSKRAKLKQAMQDQSRMEISPFVKEEDKQTLKRKLAEMSSNENYMFTVPEAPVLRTAERVRRYIQETTDEIQTRMAQENFEREKKKRKMLVDKWDKANIPVKTLPLTQPMDIHLHTENRLQFNPSTEEPNPKKVKFNPPVSQNTVPEPFVFACEERALLKNQMKTSASLITDNNKLDFSKANYSFHGGPTKPQPFRFETESRSMFRAKPQVLTREQQEELELQNIQPFKAKPIQWQDFQMQTSTKNSTYKPPTVTQPQPFSFQTEERVTFRKPPSSSSTSSHNEFKALPLDHSMFQPKQDKPTQKMELTEPHSPAFYTKHRRNIKRILKPRKPEIPTQFVAMPMPDFQHTFKPPTKPSFNFITEPIPFQLQTEQRGSAHKDKFRHALSQKEKEEESAREFKARNMPVFEKPVAPVKNVELTEPEPFSLSTQARGDLHLQQLKTKIDEEEKQNKQKREFKARPMIVEEPKPLFTEKNRKPFTNISNITLNSEVRAQKRKLWDMQLAEKEKELEEYIKMKEFEMKKKEEEEIKAYRASLVHKPEPVTWNTEKITFPAFVTKPLTEPISPAFKTKNRALRLRNV